MRETDTFTGRWIAELRRRRVFRTAALYIVGAWLIMQVADVSFPALDIPERAIRYVLIAAVLGFPAALLFGWFFDIGAGGIRRTAPSGPGEADFRPLQRSDYLILAALVAVAVVIVYNVVQNVADEPGVVVRRTPDGPPMVAVLPFTAASLAGENEFFAVGVHDDLLTQLAKLQSIRVISRTSVLEYKDVKRNIREIGAELGADAILEGGVQIAGGQIRINAQLIDAATDQHLWADTYDRELTASNIFEVQAEIARAITSAMHATLSEQDTGQLAAIPTDNLAAYRAYRQALEFPGTKWRNLEYRALLEEAVALDPEFTRAWAMLVGHLSHANFYNEHDPAEIARAEEILDTINRLAPGSADDWLAQALYTYYVIRDFDQALVLIDRARELVPSDVTLLEIKSWIQRRQGDLEGRIETFRLARKLDPKEPQWSASLVNSLIAVHRYDEAEEELDKTDFESIYLEQMRNLMELREHGDLGRWATRESQILDEYGHRKELLIRHDILIARRDFAGAANFIKGKTDPNYDDSLPFGTDVEMSTLESAWFLGQVDQHDELVQELIERMEASRKPNGEFEWAGTNVHMAGVLAFIGEYDEAAQYMRRGVRALSGDFAGLMSIGFIRCRIFGMAADVAGAVACIREGATKPLGLVPFYEVLMPHYDAIRDDPLFVELYGEFW